ncbi:hypothetical protein DOY81_009273, partial [Sarcophaga bullata]
SGGFMGDIALPDVEYGSDDYPIVASTRVWNEPQADAPMKEPAYNYNDTFQKEMEILKQEVYHEGLQVEEEGLTDIIRRKTKLPSNKPDLENELIQSANELLKPSIHSNYPSINFKNEVISSEEQSVGSRKYPIVMEPKKHKTIEAHTAEIGPLDKTFNTSGEKYDFGFLAREKTVSEEEKHNKSSIGMGNRNVDQRKIQSNTKDIELDTGNNFVSERKVVILPTSLPNQRSTLPNVYSNAGGNGMKLDEIQEIKGTSTIVKRRHRRGRKHRRSYGHHHRAEYNAKLQQLKEELNRPIGRPRHTKKPQNLQQNSTARKAFFFISRKISQSNRYRERYIG